MVKTITTENLNETISDGVSLIKFGAKWCGPCRQLAPIIDKLGETFDGKAIIGDVDIDDNQDLAAEFGIRSVPTTIIFVDGKEEDRIIGMTAGDALSKKLVNLIG